jgi:predicted glycosyltransferase
MLDQAGEEVGPDHLAGRRELLLATLAESRPDVLVTELFPFGRRALRDEFLALIRTARELRPPPLIASSIRDILVAPAKLERVARAHGILAEFYDAVLVHGDPALLPLEASWPVGDGVGAPLIYTGYVDPEIPAVTNMDGREILVAGGSSASALPLFRAALAAAKIVDDRPWRILVGHGIADGADLHSRPAPNVTVERARPDFRELMAASAAFVGQAGYNTVLDLFAARPRAVLVPFEEGNETEQRLRADLLERLGAAVVLPQADLSGERLAAMLREVLARPRPAAVAVARDGARRTAEILSELAREAGRKRQPA